MAESAVSLAIEYLVPLLVQEERLLRGFHDKVLSIRGELEMIQSFLKDADDRAEKEGMSNVAKTWAKQAREKSYHIEDIIDEYILHLAKHPQMQRKRFHFLLKIFQFTTKLKPRHVIASKIQDINNELKVLREREVKDLASIAWRKGGQAMVLDVSHGMTLERHPFSLRTMNLWALRPLEMN